MSEHDALAVLLAGFEGPDVPSWLHGAVADGLAGVCLYGNNVAPGRDIRDLTAAVRALDPDLIVALDEEGGDVTRLHVADASPAVTPAALGRFDDVRATRAVAAGIGAELAACGVSMTLAPCADVNSDPRNPVIGTRSFGADPALVSRHVAAFIAGLSDAGIAACAKHFPGHGDTASDSHLTLPVVDLTVDALAARELPPFAAAIEAGVPAVMTSHILLPHLDDAHPATMSHRVLTGLLRGTLGFEGLIVTDALDMAGASATLGLGEAAVRSLQAGADLLCLGPQTGPHPDAVRCAAEAITSAVAGGRLEATRLRSAADRVRDVRRSWPRRSHPEPGPVIAEADRTSQRVARAVVTPLPPEPRRRYVHVDVDVSPAIGETAWGVPAAERSFVAADDLSRQPLPEGPVALVARGATRHPSAWSWIRAALEANDQAWLVETAWPDPRLNDLDRTVVTWGSSRPQLAAVRPPQENPA